jgi:hypothetical protein
VGLWHVVAVGRRVCSPAGITRVCCGEKARRYGNQVELVKALSERNCDWPVFGKEGDFERSEGGRLRYEVVQLSPFLECCKLKRGQVTLH